MVNIIVNNNVLETDGGTTFAVSKAVSKIGDLQKRHGDFSVNMSVPLTAKNSKYFGGLFNLNREASPSFERFSARLEENNAVISEGYIQIYSVKGGRVTFRFYGGNSDWFNILGDDTLQDLPLSSLNHEYSHSEITGSFGNTEGFKYALIDNGLDVHTVTTVNTKPNDYALCVYQKNLIEAITSKYGLKFQGSFLNDPLYSSVLIPQRRAFKSIYEQTQYERTFNINNFLMISTGSQGANPVLQRAPFTRTGTDANFDGFRYTFNTEITTLNGSEIQLVTQTGGNEASFKAYLLYGKADGSTEEVEVSLTTNFNISNTNARVLNKLDLQTLAPVGFLPVSAGDYVEFLGIEFSGAVGEPTATLYNEIKGSETYFKIVPAGVAFYPTIDVAKELPALKLTEFIKDLMFRSGLYSAYDGSAGTVYLNKWDDIEKNKQKAIDWSGKIDYSKGYFQDFNKFLSKYKRNNIIKYKEDSNDLTVQVYNRFVAGAYPFGGGNLLIDSENKQGESNLYESPFAPTISRWSFPYDLATPSNQKVYVPFIPYYGETEEDENEIEPRVLIDSGNIDIDEISKGLSSFNIADFVTGAPNNAINSVGYAFFAKTILSGTNVSSDTLNNGSFSLCYNTPNGFTTSDLTLIERGYNLLSRTLKRAYSLEVYVKLEAFEVANVDFSIPIRIREDYFYLDEISQYKNRNTPVLCRLVKL